jgi:hypothetical protein
VPGADDVIAALLVDFGCIESEPVETPGESPGPVGKPLSVVVGLFAQE